MSDKKSGLALLRQPFPANAISKLPKPTKRQTDEVRDNFKNGIRCKLCGAWHHPDVVHVDYVGHAALTDRLLDCDPEWNWKPVAVSADGTPVMDENGGMWISLTVCGVTRLGYGHPDGKRGGDAIKEVIGDALRNAAMRFGAALDLWHKGDLHADDAIADAPKPEPNADKPKRDPKKIASALIKKITDAKSQDDLNRVLGGAKFDAAWQWLAEEHEDDSRDVRAAVDERRAALEQPSTAALLDDEIPY